MEWRIRKSSHGGFVAEYGIQIEGGCLAPSGVGYLMPGFFVYRSSHFDTQEQAERYIKKEEGKRPAYAK